MIQKMNQLSQRMRAQNLEFITFFKLQNKERQVSRLSHSNLITITFI
jgi:hypothetical protein